MLFYYIVIIMNPLSLYTNTCRLVLETNQNNKDSYIQLYKLLPALRQSLLCVACGSLVKDPYTSSEKVCQHHVCKQCIGTTRLPHLGCDDCPNDDSFEKDKQIELVLKCYVKLCSFIKNTGLIKSICSIITNGGSCNIGQLIDEACPEPICLDSSSSDSKNKELSPEQNAVASTNQSCDEEVFETQDTSTCSSQWNSENVDDDVVKSYDCSQTLASAKEIFVDPSTEISNAVQVLPAPDVMTQNAISQMGVNTMSVTSQTSNKVSVIPWSEAQVNNVIHSNQDISRVVQHNVACPPATHEEDVIQRVQQYSIAHPTSSAHIVQPTLNNEAPKIYHPMFQSTRPRGIVNTMESSGVKACFYNVRPAQVFSGTSNKDMAIPGTTSVANQAVYSVTYRDNDSTKITLKRNPIDIENMKMLNESDQFKCPSADEVKKKRPKPKAKRKGCRCGNATQTPGKLTCCGQRCPCYVAAKACIECQCRGCRNPHRPGGKKVRPHIPQLENIKIHQVQAVHPKPPAIVSHKSNIVQHNNSVSSIPRTTAINVNYAHKPSYRTVQTANNSQNAAGLPQFHAIQSGVHQFINIGGNIVDPMYSSQVNIHTKQELSTKPVGVISSIPAHLLINDDKSSNSASDASDVDVDS